MKNDEINTSINFVQQFDALTQEEQDALLREQGCKYESLTPREKIIHEYLSYKRHEGMELILSDDLMPILKEHPEQAETILEILSMESDSSYHLPLAYVLIDLKNPMIIPFLINMMRTGEYFKSSAAKALIGFKNREAQEFLIQYAQETPSDSTKEEHTNNIICSINDEDNDFAQETIKIITGGKTAKEVQAEYLATLRPSGPRYTMIVAMYRLARRGRPLMLGKKFAEWAATHLHANPSEMPGLIYLFDREKNRTYKVELGKILAHQGLDLARDFFYEIVRGEQAGDLMFYLAMLGLVFLEDTEGIKLFKDLVNSCHDQPSIAALLEELSSLDTATTRQLAEYIYQSGKVTSSA